MNRVYIKTYGCQMNERDSEAVAAMLRDRGYSMVETEHDADVVLLNTCAVRDQAEQKAIGKFGHLARRKKTDPDFVLGIMGCMAQNRGTDLVDTLPDLDLLVGTQKFHRVPEMLDQLLRTERALGPRPSTLVDLDEEEGSASTIRQHHQGKRQVTAFVSIMQGCNMHCAFCIVPKTRGAERYRSIAEIVEEVHELAAQGTREITLLGQIVNNYGSGEIRLVDGKSAFVQLIEAVAAVPGIERVRFTSPHPKGFKKDLIQAYGRVPELCEYVHLPLQSGSDRILKLMRRPYTADRFRRIVRDLRAVRPDIYLSTDIIVGFPGETDEDYQQTRDLFEEIGFDMAFIFKYSERSGTRSAEMDDDVPAEAKDARNKDLLTVLETSSLRRNEGLVGTTQQILIEGPAKRGESMFVGRNRGNRKVIVSASERLIGQLVDVHIDSATVTTLMGSLVLTGVEEPTLAQA